VNTVQGTMASPAGKAFKTYPLGRLCAKRGCDTILSQYNKGKLCHLHTPIKAPRLRGKMPSERMEKEELIKYHRCASCSQRNRHIRDVTGREVRDVLIGDEIHKEGSRGRATLCEEP